MSVAARVTVTGDLDQPFNPVEVLMLPEVVGALLSAAPTTMDVDEAMLPATSVERNSTVTWLPDVVATNGV